LQERVTKAIQSYQEHLQRQPLAALTRDAYRHHVERFGGFLVGWSGDFGDPLTDPHARDFAVRDFKSHLKRVGKMAPSSINLAIAAVDSFYRDLGLGRPNVKREALPALAPRALEPEELKRYLRAVERLASVRDRAIVGVLLNAGLRVSEASGLQVDDVQVSARKGTVRVLEGKGGVYRTVPLNTEARESLAAWLQERRTRQVQTQALFLSRTGMPMDRRSIDLVVRGLGAEVGLVVSSHRLRHTFCTRLLREAKADLVLVAELAGHRRLDTTRRYTLPTEADRAAAVEALTGMD
jgi:site-specific recombinase XerD